MGKIKPSHSSSERMRWNAQDGTACTIAQGPGEGGNEFHVRMHEHRNSAACVRSIVRVIKESGVCTVEANAPPELLREAHEEAELLWKHGAFGPPWQVWDDQSQTEAQIWHASTSDEDKVVWLNRDPLPDCPTKALALLQKNMSDFSTSIMERINQELGVHYDCFWDAMVSCYAGDRQYDCHIDNPHQGDERGYPDNGMRLTMVYYINPTWEPSGEHPAGLDVFLTDPSCAPTSSSEARKAPRLRVAPHADTLVLFLSERMAHQVLPTRGKERWYCLTLWTLDGQSLEAVHSRYEEIRRRNRGDDSDSD